jgi:hypothetical protein
MNVSSEELEDIERKIREKAEGLPSDTLWERADLCIGAETAQPIFGKVYCEILKEVDPTDERAYLGLTQCLMMLGQPEQALAEAANGKEIIARLCAPDCRDAFEAYLMLHFFSYSIEKKKKNDNSPFKLLVLEGMRQKFIKKDHIVAQKFFMKAAKAGTEEERNEAYFYASTLFELGSEIIEKNLMEAEGPPADLFLRLPEYERGYLRQVRKHILDTYLPCDTSENINKNFGRGNSAPISREELKETKRLMKSIRTFDDLGF